MYYLTYKDYYTIIHYSKTDKVFYGKLEDMPHLISIESETLEQFEINFKEAVEDYLSVCDTMRTIPSTPKSLPKLLSNYIICDSNKDYCDLPFRRVVGFDKENKQIILGSTSNTFLYYIGINVEDFENNWTNNIDEIQEQIQEKKNELTKYIDFIEMITEKIGHKTLNGYAEIIFQLNYFENIQNPKLLQNYGNYIRDLKKGKRRKEKYFHRFLTDVEIEKIKEILKTKKSFKNDTEIVKLKNLKKFEKKLKKMIEENHEI